ncbi:MAG: hypothetical protein R3F54_22670 [Alphaproteobacteria bacterium]
MPGYDRYLPVIVLAISFGAAAAEAAERSQSTCTSGSLVRRVIVEAGDLSTGLPCEVVYWKDTEAPGVRRVLWNARSDAAFCDGKAAGLVGTLASAGWNCTSEGQPTGAAAAPAPSPTQAFDAAAVGRIEPSAAPPQQPAASVATGTPALGVPPTSQGTASLGTASPGAVLQPAPAAGNLQTAAVAPATATGTATGQPPKIDRLQTVIQSNLASLNETVDGDFQAQIGDFGDLNNDGVDDAVVFFNYESSTADFTQFVAAYLFNGEDYHLAATKPVGGTDLAVRQVEVEDIVDGLIQLRLVLNDASQSENRRAAMILKDGQLVETQ